ncbi:MAG: porin [Gammaproteobacteria bacterium]|nr:porin [Gammaproteobacteria bacterium]
MKKSLTALAVMAAVSLPFAANAGDMEAEVYGKMHGSIDYVNNANDASFFDSVHMSANSSRLGFKGAADLGGGMKAVWKVESDVAQGEADGKTGLGTTGIGNRATYVGLSTGAGTVTMGRDETPVKLISRKTDLFGDQIGDSRNVMQGKVTDRREGESVQYVSPAVAGAQLAIMTTLSDAKYNSTTGKQDAANFGGFISASVTYKMGKELYAALGYQMADGNSLGKPAAETEGVTRLGLKYSMGAIGVNALFQMTSNEGGTKDLGRMAYGVGAAYKMGKMSIKAQYYGATASVDTKKDEASILAIGVDQKLGDKTTAYVAYAMSMNGADASAGVSGAGHDNPGGDTGKPGKGDGAMGLSVGMIHSF